MKPPRTLEVEPSEDRARTRRRVIARGSDAPVAPKLVRTRAAVVLKSDAMRPRRIGTETEIIDISTEANTKPTRQFQHTQNLFGLLDPEGEPPPAPALPANMTPEEISIARRDSHRTRRMHLSQSELVEVHPDGTRSGPIPLAEWTRAPSIEIEVEVPPHLMSEARQQSYRRGLVMGVAIATSVSAALATVLALIM
jgi:hypothetical protein